MAAPGAAQSVQGTVSITVTDPAGAVIPGAKVELKDAATNDLRTGLSRPVFSKMGGCATLVKVR